MLPIFPLFFLLLASISVDGLKILVVAPKFGRSHMQFLGQIADLYVRNGHEVVYFEPEIIAGESVLEFQSTKLARVIKKKQDWEADRRVFAAFVEQGWTEDHENILRGLESFKDFIAALGKSCQSILEDKDLLRKLSNKKFDIAIAESITLCPYALYRKIGIKKYITASAAPIGAGFGAVFGTSVFPAVAHIPEMFTVPFERGTFMFRLLNMLNYIGGDMIFRSMFAGTIMKVIHEHYPDMTLEHMLTNSSYFFNNANDHVEFVRAMPSKFVNVAGIGVPKVKPLSEDYQKFMDTAKEGVVLVSFGSSSQSRAMPPHVRQAFLDAFDHFPHVKFLWKFENATIDVAKGHPNVLAREWVPQVDILNHKNTIGFISHGGMNSLIESNVFGVPTLCIALFGDQPRNCKMVTERGLSIRLDKATVTKDTLIEALKELIYNEKYLKQAREVQKMIQNAPLSAEERVLRYTEFAAKFDIAKSLDDEARHLNTVAFYNLDIFAILIFAALLVLYVFWRIVKLIARCVFAGVSKLKSE